MVAHALAVLLELLEPDFTFVIHVDNAMLEALEVNLGGSRVHLLFDLIDLLFDFTEPLVEGLLHLGRIDPTILDNLGALYKIGSSKGRR